MLVVVNAQARGGRAARLVPALRQRLAELAPPAQLVVPASVDEARACVRACAPGSRVVVVGGDGTLHQLLGALHERRAVTGLVPFGSGDDSARAFGLRGLPWPRALAHALAGTPRAVDLGEVSTAHETRLFVSSLAAGFDAAVAQRALAGPRWLAGLLRYLWATLGELAALQLHELAIEADGRTLHQGPALFASTLNTASYGGGMPAVPGARPDDGRLDLLVAGRFGRAQALAMLPRLLAGWHLSHPRVQAAAFGQATITSPRPVPLAADGEAMQPADRLRLRVRPGALQVVVHAP